MTLKVRLKLHGHMWQRPAFWMPCPSISHPTPPSWAQTDSSPVQGFFDVPVDNLYGRPLLKRYIQTHIPDYKDAVIISPDAGGAKRATAIADSMGVEFALIHKVIVFLACLPATYQPFAAGTSSYQDHRPPKRDHDAGRQCGGPRLHPH